jgi:hypothetical protein
MSKSITENTSRFWVRCTPEQYRQIKEMAKNAGVTVGEMALMKLLNLQLDYEEEIIDHPTTKTLKDGTEKKYSRRYVSRKKILVPAGE